VRTATSKQWLLIKHKDRFAQQNDVLARAQSVHSGHTLDDRQRPNRSSQMDAERLTASGPAETMPKTMSPMLAEIGDAPRSDHKWSYEPKVDGYRAIAFVQDGAVRLQSRRGIDLTPAFPEITAGLATQAVDRMILDGEILALDARADRRSMRCKTGPALKQPKEIAEAQRQTSVVFLCFDMLHFAGLNLRGNPYVDRRRYLSQCLLPSAHIQLVHVSDDAERLYAAALESGFEGIVSKRKDSTYQPGRRSTAWLKTKAVHSSEFVVGGYTQGKGAREALGSLLLGYWQGDELHYVGHVGSGLDDKVLRNLRERLAKLTAKRSPFAEKPPLHRPTNWLKPELVAEVNFAGWTPDGNLRAPVFLRLRDDITSRSIVSGPEKSAAPPVTEVSSANQIEEALAQLESKANRIDLRVGRCAYPAHESRPRVLARQRARQATSHHEARSAALPHPRVALHAAAPRKPAADDDPHAEGINGERFFQKHWSQERPEFVESVTVFSGHRGEKHEYLLANNLPSLIWLGQVGTLEFHVWHSRAEVGPDAASKRTDYSSSLKRSSPRCSTIPTTWCFDIDPYIYSGKEAKGAEPELNKKGFATGRRVAFWLRDLLKEMSLEAVVKTSGKTGLHVFVPIERTVTFDEARTLCEMVGRHLMREHPREITMEWAIEKRTGKIFYDYNMNVRERP
jgi:bifunctional non-homologous end joining protein LigD